VTDFTQNDSMSWFLFFVIFKSLFSVIHSGVYIWNICKFNLRFSEVIFVSIIPLLRGVYRY